MPDSIPSESRTEVVKRYGARVLDKMPNAQPFSLFSIPLLFFGVQHRRLAEVFYPFPWLVRYRLAVNCIALCITVGVDKVRNYRSCRKMGKESADLLSVLRRDVGRYVINRCLGVVAEWIAFGVGEFYFQKYQ